MQESQRLKELENEIWQLKKSLADAIATNQMLERLIEMANQEFDTDLKKDFGYKLYLRRENG